MSTVHSAYAEGFDIQSEDHAVRSFVAKGATDIRPAANHLNPSGEIAINAVRAELGRLIRQFPLPPAADDHIFVEDCVQNGMGVHLRIPSPRRGNQHHLTFLADDIAANPTPPAHDLNNRQPTPPYPQYRGRPPEQWAEHS